MKKKISIDEQLKRVYDKDGFDAFIKECKRLDVDLDEPVEVSPNQDRRLIHSDINN